MRISFTVPGQPQARQAHNHTVVAGKVRKYMPKESAAFQDRVRAYAFEAMAGRSPIGAMCRIEITAYFQAPKALTKARRAELIEKGSIRYASRKNDWDNIGKNICDSLKQVVIEDDGLFVSANVEKWISYTPRTEITVSILEEL